MRREEKKVVDSYKGYTISLGLSTGKFSCGGLVSDHDSLGAAKKAIDAAVKGLMDVKRRPVIVHDTRYSYRSGDEDDKWQFGELTSFSAHDWSRPGNLHANVVQNKERSEFDPDDVYEDTPENRALMKRAVEIDRSIATLEKEREFILTEQMKRVAVPNLKGEEP